MTRTAIIVGAGQAGAHAAIAMRAAGFTGRVLLIGAERERPYERPPLSKAWLTEEEEPEIAYFHDVASYSTHNIEALLGVPAARLNVSGREVTLADGRRFGYDRLLLATGGRARRLDVPGAGRVLSLRTLDDARALRGRLRPGARVVCIGAGVIGLEVASSARMRGCVVTVVEAASSVMSRCLTPELSDWLVGLHRAAGVTVHLETGVACIGADAVVTDVGYTIPADVVVAGIGMARNTELAEQAGLAVENGIEVDEFGRASAPEVYAAGDVAAFWVPRLGRRLRLESWRHAQDHGTLVGRAMVDACTPYDDIPWFWTGQHGRTLQVAGTPGPVVVRRGVPGPLAFSVWYLDEAGRVVGVVGVDSAREVRAGQMLIRGAQPADSRLLADPNVAPQRLTGL